jgi:hypothetical protein
VKPQEGLKGGTGMIVFAVAPTESMEKCPDGKKAGGVTISVRPKQTLRKRLVKVKQIGEKESKMSTAASD